MRINHSDQIGDLMEMKISPMGMVYLKINGAILTLGLALAIISATIPLTGLLDFTVYAYSRILPVFGLFGIVFVLYLDEKKQRNEFNPPP
jgi:pilus assembly protein TadC